MRTTALIDPSRQLRAHSRARGAALAALAGSLLATTASAAPVPSDPRWCGKLPPSINVDSLRVRQEKTLAPKVVPFAGPIPSVDVAGCKAMLPTSGVCRIGDLVIVDVSKNVKAAGRCESHPKGTRTWAITDALFDLIVNKAVQAVPDFAKRIQSLTFYSVFKQTYSETVPEDQEQSCPLAYHFKMYNDIGGLGKAYGSQPPTGQVFTSFTNAWSVQDWTEQDWFDTTGVTPLNILTHEVEHDICCYVKFHDTEKDVVSRDLIGEGGAHWSLYHNTYGQLMYGCNWREEGNGSFYSIEPARGLRPLDLYLWGLIPPTEVPPIFLVNTKAQPCTPKQQTLDAIAKDCAEMPLNTAGTIKCKDDMTTCLTKFDLCLDPPYYRTLDGGCEPHSKDEVQTPEGLTAKGQKRWVTIDNIIAASKNRNPDWTASYKVNTYLFELILGPEDELTQRTVDLLERVRLAWSRHHYNTTGFRMRIRSTVDGAEDCPLWEWGGVPEWKNDDALEGWTGVALKQPLAIKVIPTGITEGTGNALELQLQNETSGITHENLRLVGKYYDALQVVLTVPPAAGGAKLLHGKLKLKGAEGTKDAEVRFPILADGKKHKVTVHPPQALITATSCAGCVPQCKNVGKPDEGWTDCAGNVIKAGQCKNKEGQLLCGPYCTSGKTDTTLGDSDPEGWYDSCTTRLDGTYEALTLLPVIEPEASGLSGPVIVDRIDLFRVSEVPGLDENKKKDGEKDYDGDGLVNAYDNCPTVANASQLDSTGDDKGDACGDFDSDGIVDALDNCPTVVNSLQQDDDVNGAGNACDPGYEASGCSLSTARRVPLVGFVLFAFALVALVLRRRRG